MNLLIRSLQMDWEFIFLEITMQEKIEFIFKKYSIYLRNIFAARLGVVKLFGYTYYFDDKYGLAVLQSTYNDNAFLKHFISKNAVVVDIGANIGQFRFFSEHFLKAKRVYSFEPIHTTFLTLKKNFPKRSINTAIATKKKLTFYIPELSVWASALPQENNVKKEIVIGMRLYEIRQVQNEKVIDLLKIDVEGAEQDTLLASRKIAKRARYILIETSIDRTANVNVFTLLEQFRRILPSVELVRIGRSYNNPTTHTTGAVDLLFKNSV